MPSLLSLAHAPDLHVPNESQKIADHLNKSGSQHESFWMFSSLLILVLVF